MYFVCASPNWPTGQSFHYVGVRRVCHCLQPRCEDIYEDSIDRDEGLQMVAACSLVAPINNDIPQVMTCPTQPRPQYMPPPFQIIHYVLILNLACRCVAVGDQFARWDAVLLDASRGTQPQPHQRYIDATTYVRFARLTTLHEKPQKRLRSHENGGYAANTSVARRDDPGELPIFINAGDNLDLNDLNTPIESLLPYKLLKNLGHGGSAIVEKVEDVHTGRVYARKVFRNVYARNLTQAKQRLRDEVQIMKILAAHHHIVRVHATYIVKRELAIILDPVANGGDLASFLQDFKDTDVMSESWPSKCHILWKSFGCLASGLAFMHRQTIRHKDIKPQNILIHRGDVMYTDFGLSYDFGDTGQSTTTGIVQGMTKRYCAPEVADGASRNSKSDVFSLGCVYIEILAALEPGSISDEVLSGPFYEVLKVYTTEGTLPQHVGLSYSSHYLLIDQKMLQESPADRPPASQIFRALQDATCDMQLLYNLCDRCCFHHQAEASGTLRGLPATFDLQAFLTMIIKIGQPILGRICCGVQIQSWETALVHFQQSHATPPALETGATFMNPSVQPSLLLDSAGLANVGNQSSAKNFRFNHSQPSLSPDLIHPNATSIPTGRSSKVSEYNMNARDTTFDLSADDNGQDWNESMHDRNSNLLEPRPPRQKSLNSYESVSQPNRDRVPQCTNSIPTLDTSSQTSAKANMDATKNAVFRRFLPASAFERLEPHRDFHFPWIAIDIDESPGSNSGRPDVVPIDTHYDFEDIWGDALDTPL